MPRRLPASQAELEGPCWGWRVQASPLPSPAYWSMLGNSKAGGEEEGEGLLHKTKGRLRKTSETENLDILRIDSGYCLATCACTASLPRYPDAGKKDGNVPSLTFKSP
ncbi:hypothetical protein FQA47_011130 [Oryzias melastigma]|uniref:Uncharacterized protein n=1 Tax=Oryzias melastigma TaxID=30732 RepID=A0A834FJG3_ORYME|nr:hypothetical protein FQA47_011130 [Oryzias melastigma]